MPIATTSQTLRLTNQVFLLLCRRARKRDRVPPVNKVLLTQQRNNHIATTRVPNHQTRARMGVSHLVLKLGLHLVLILVQLPLPKDSRKVVTLIVHRVVCLRIVVLVLWFSRSRIRVRISHSYKAKRLQRHNRGLVTTWLRITRHWRRR